MGSEREIINLVWKQLEEIDKLKCEKGSKPQNAARTTYLQSCICRKYVIIEFLTSLIENPMSKMRIESVVGLKRKEDGAEIEDVRRMPVPKLVTAQKLKEWREDKKNEITLDPFPYLDLPPEVQRTMLGYLSNPTDQLNVTKAIPADAAMMGWYVDSLRLELILPIVFDRTKLGYQEAANLCHASTELHDVVRNCFGRILADPLAAKNNLGCRYKHVNEVAPADYILNPLPCTVVMNFRFNEYPPNNDDSDDDEDDYDEWKLKQLDILRQFGENVWSFHLFIYLPPSSLQMIQLIRDCVELMPNLRTLSVNIDLLDYLWSLDEEQIKNVQFPQLRYLKHLKLLGFGALNAVYDKLLDQYRSGITFLETVHVSDLPIISPEETGYPRLTHLKSSDNRADNSEAKRNKVLRLNTFVGSALKWISFRGGYDNHKAADFISKLRTLAQFGETLEHLSIEFAINKVPVGDKKSAELSQLADINFPKVKTLEVRGYPSTWMFLLSFPSLEKLAFIFPDFPGVVGRYATGYFDSTDILGLSFVKKELYTAGIWKLLPFLKKISVGLRPFLVTRSQCLAYQRKLAEIKELMEQADITMEGPVTNVLQPSDTTFVVKGDVNGNVVQQGNGIILVTGKVRGKIEQKGDGKIFVRGKHHGALSKTGNGIVEVDWANVKN